MIPTKQVSQVISEVIRKLLSFWVSIISVWKICYICSTNHYYTIYSTIKILHLKMIKLVWADLKKSLVFKWRILGKCILTSSLPGKVLHSLLNHKACQAIQHEFSKLSLVNLISKDANLVFYLSAYQVTTLKTSVYDVIIMFFVDSLSLTTSFKKCNVMMTW